MGFAIEDLIIHLAHSHSHQLIITGTPIDDAADGDYGDLSINAFIESQCYGTLVNSPGRRTDDGAGNIIITMALLLVLCLHLLCSAN